ncbi:MAG: Re/Si-specific NAD(P)(+) transhydrogenase subunit alpha [Pseudomonadales bacterium]|jgi:NAD(P) transhydrogenase subunit alpha|nr:Re/Si-specific NAD(P)(+) transhydrogenase subunit alpha [Pseudomonadales bacterium]
MILGIPRETSAGERRVAMIPADLARLEKLGIEVLVEPGAGSAAGFPDSEYVDKKATIAASRAELFERSDIIVGIRAAGAAPDTLDAELGSLRRGQVVIAQADPLGDSASAQRIAETGCTLFALELVPRITRAQSMDVLSSQASIAGYKAVLLAATELPRMFPMFNTAAGTVKPAKVLVIGAGVAGLQAIATARRLGAVVSAYDIRPAVKEQVQSLGAKFVELELETEGAETAGGYAKAQSEDQIKKQQELMAQHIAASDVVVTTAAVPGKKAPVLVTRDMVEAMAPGSLVCDLAAERGGNCALTEPGRTVNHEGVTILGPENVPGSVPYHASQMYARNVAEFLKGLVKEGQLTIDLEDEVLRDTLVCRDGEVVHTKVRELLGLPALAPAPQAGGSEEGGA